MKNTKQRLLSFILLALLAFICLFPIQAQATVSPGTLIQESPRVLNNCSLNPCSFENPLDEVHYWLENYFVDPVPEEVLNASTIEETLELLGDPYTAYFTAEEYAEFSNSIELNYTGIGIYMDLDPQGIRISSVIPGSPAEDAGFCAGDVILEADGQSLAGMSLEEAGSILRGPEGTSVMILLLHNDNSTEINLIRRSIQVPAISSAILDSSIGYLDLDTFGSSTSSLFSDELENLQAQSADSYILDLRDNGGGYVSTALNIAGHFIGDNVAMQTHYRNSYSEDRAVSHGSIIEEAVIVLINENSASASEILSGAIKDYGSAVFIGNTSYGKGCMQGLFSLDSGDYLKMTIARFYSPLGNEIHGVGISPDLEIEESDSLQAARLLLSGSTEQADKSGLLKVTLAGHEFAIDSSQAQETEYWPVYAEILDELDSTELMRGRSDAWETVSSLELQEKWSLYYPGYRQVSKLENVSNNKVFTIRFSHPYDMTTVNSSSIELREKDSGETLELHFNPLNSTELQLVPVNGLQSGTDYWLLVHPNVHSLEQKPLSQGSICTISVE